MPPWEAPTFSGYENTNSTIDDHLDADFLQDVVFPGKPDIVIDQFIEPRISQPHNEHPVNGLFKDHNNVGGFNIGLALANSRPQHLLQPPDSGSLGPGNSDSCCESFYLDF
jgi:hypothetical protein